MTDYVAAYYETVTRMLREIVESQRPAIEAAGTIVAETVRDEGVAHLFGTGHSHMLAEELYYRAGGLVPVNAVLDEGMMLHQSGLKSTLLERLPGYAGSLMMVLNPSKKDCLFVISNSGRNPVPVEMATEAKKRGLRVIALTSLDASSAQGSRAPSGKRLFEVADVVLDNRGVPGDASVPVAADGTAVGPTSTVTGAFLLNAAVAHAVSLLQEWKIEPPLFTSGNVEGSDARNLMLIQKYQNKVRF